MIDPVLRTSKISSSEIGDLLTRKEDNLNVVSRNDGTRGEGQGVIATKTFGQMIIDGAKKELKEKKLKN